jgi:hypothetical protein
MIPSEQPAYFLSTRTTTKARAPHGEQHAEACASFILSLSKDRTTRGVLTGGWFTLSTLKNGILHYQYAGTFQTVDHTQRIESVHFTESHTGGEKNNLPSMLQT